MWPDGAPDHQLSGSYLPTRAIAAGIMYIGVIFSFCVGVAGLAIALFFGYLGVAGDLVFDDTPPVIVRAVLVAFAVLFAPISLFAIWHAVRQALVRSASKPKSVVVDVRTISASESATYELHIRHENERWIAPAYGGRGVDQVITCGPIVGEAWFDEKHNTPMSVKVNGFWITTYPKIMSVSAANCLV